MGVITCNKQYGSGELCDELSRKLRMTIICSFNVICPAGKSAVNYKCAKCGHVGCVEVPKK